MFARKLTRGEPVTILVLGASVAQQGGCHEQPGARCMDYSGRAGSSVVLPWGRPRSRRFPGFLVRWFDVLNQTWPHAGHRLVNAAVDGTPMQALLPCLLSRIPDRVDLVLLEIASMADQLRLTAIEGVARRLLSLPATPPALCFLTVPLWHSAPQTVARRVAAGRFGLRRSCTAAAGARWARVEAATDAVCHHYNVSCLSMYRALGPNVHSSRTGFRLDEVAADCLHPASGTLGTEYVTDVLVHWLLQLASAESRALGGSISRSPGLPSALNPTSEDVISQAAACFGFQNQAGSNGTSADTLLGKLSRTKTMRAPLVWHTAYCAVAGASPFVPATSTVLLGTSSSSAVCVEADVGVDCKQGKLDWGARLPRVWFYCGNALGPTRKRSPGIIALVPGATLFFALRPPPFVIAREDNSRPRRPAIAARIRLLHLVSYENMGIVRLRCTAGCRCNDTLIDAHRLSRRRNVSVFTESEVSVWLEPIDSCGIELRVDETTSSGSHKFRLRSLTLLEGHLSAELRASKRKRYTATGEASSSVSLVPAQFALHQPMQANDELLSGLFKAKDWLAASGKRDLAHRVLEAITAIYIGREDHVQPIEKKRRL